MTAKTAAATTRLRSAARIVMALHDHAASFTQDTSWDATARVTGALMVWEALTNTTGDDAIALARLFAEEDAP